MFGASDFDFNDGIPDLVAVSPPGALPGHISVGKPPQTKSKAAKSFYAPMQNQKPISNYTFFCRQQRAAAGGGLQNTLATRSSSKLALDEPVQAFSVKMVTPTPALVLKLRSNSLSCLYINLCVSDLIPLPALHESYHIYLVTSKPAIFRNNENSKSTSNLNISPELPDSWVKIYDVVLNPKVIESSRRSNQATYDKVMVDKVLFEAVSLINAIFNEGLSSESYEIMENVVYKNSISSNSSSSSQVRQIFVPTKHDFAKSDESDIVYLSPNESGRIHNSQSLASRSIDYNAKSNLTTSTSHVQSERGLLAHSTSSLFPQSQSFHAPSRSFYDSIDGDVASRHSDLAGESGRASSNAVVRKELDKHLQFFVLPLSDLKKLTALLKPLDQTSSSLVTASSYPVSKTFGDQLNNIDFCEQYRKTNYEDLFICPVPGFVVTVDQVSPRQQRFVINILHHAKVGDRKGANVVKAASINRSQDGGDDFKRKKSFTLNGSRAPSASNLKDPTAARGFKFDRLASVKLVPFIIAKVHHFSMSITEDDQLPAEVILDVVVSSSVYSSCMEDATGYTRGETVAAILHSIEEKHEILFNCSQMHFPIVQSNYVSNDGSLEDGAFRLSNELKDQTMPVVLNLSEKEKETVSFLAIGKVHDAVNSSNWRRMSWLQQSSNHAQPTGKVRHFLSCPSIVCLLNAKLSKVKVAYHFDVDDEVDLHLTTVDSVLGDQRIPHSSHNVGPSLGSSSASFISRSNAVEGARSSSRCISARLSLRNVYSAESDESLVDFCCSSASTLSFYEQLTQIISSQWQYKRLLAIISCPPSEPV